MSVVCQLASPSRQGMPAALTLPACTALTLAGTDTSRLHSTDPSPHRNPSPNPSPNPNPNRPGDSEPSAEPQRFRDTSSRACAGSPRRRALPAANHMESRGRCSGSRSAGGEGGEGGEGSGGGEAVLLPRAVAPYVDAALDTAEVGLEWAESVDSSDPMFVV